LLKCAAMIILDTFQQTGLYADEQLHLFVSNIVKKIEGMNRSAEAIQLDELFIVGGECEYMPGRKLYFSISI